MKLMLLWIKFHFYTAYELLLSLLWIVLSWVVKPTNSLLKDLHNYIIDVMAKLRLIVEEMENNAN